MSLAEYKAIQARNAAREAEQISQGLASLGRDSRESFRLGATRDAITALSKAVAQLAEAVEFIEHRHRCNMEEINES